MDVFKKVTCILLCATFLNPAAWAQAGAAAPKVAPAATPTYNANRAEPITTSTRKRLAGIVFSGLGGAVLGLSTLSFYGRPQDNLQNIAIGFGLGVIGGAIFTTYKAVRKPYEDYERRQDYLGTQKEKELSREESQIFSLVSTPVVNLRWEF